MEFYTSASALKLTAAERETIKAAQAKIKAVESFGAQYGAPGIDGELSPTQTKIIEAGARYTAKPTAALAAEIAGLVLLHQNAKGIAAHFQGIGTNLRTEISRGLLPLAQTLTARVIVELDKQLHAAVASLEKIHGMTEAIADIRARHARQVEIGSFDCAELAESHRDALGWLVSTFAIDPEAELASDKLDLDRELAADFH